jgi:hypothetical protein
VVVLYVLYVSYEKESHMKKKITLSIDSDVYDELDRLPRKPSVSEIVSWVLKVMLQDVKKGRELTKDELNKYMRQTPEGADFQERFQAEYGPKLDHLIEEIETIKRKIGITNRKVKK